MDQAGENAGSRGKMSVLLVLCTLAGFGLGFSGLAASPAPRLDDPEIMLEKKGENLCNYFIRQTRLNCPSWEDGDTFCTNCPNVKGGNVNCVRQISVFIPNTKCELVGMRGNADCRECTASHAYVP